MHISYKKLWKFMIDKNIRKKDLIEKTGLSPSTIAKLGRNANVNTIILVKICKALDCDLNEIMELASEEDETS